MDIQRGSPYPAFLQGLSQSLLIHQTSSCRVDQESTLTHLHTQTHSGATSIFILLNNDLHAPELLLLAQCCVGRLVLLEKQPNTGGKTNAFQIQSDKLTKGLSKCPNDTNPSIYTEALQGLEETSQEKMTQMNVHCI